MPRGPRRDAPGVLHHVMVRGIERRAILRDDRDGAHLVAQAPAAVSAVAGPLFGLPATRVAAALGITQMPMLRGIARGLGPEPLAREVLR